jgi:hypothetical protein
VSQSCSGHPGDDDDVDADDEIDADDHEFEHGVWIDTRVASDTLSSCHLVVALRETADDDDDDVVRFDERIAVSCSLANGAPTPLRTEGAIFLRRSRLARTSV